MQQLLLNLVCFFWIKHCSLDFRNMNVMPEKPIIPRLPNDILDPGKRLQTEHIFSTPRNYPVFHPAKHR